MPRNLIEALADEVDSQPGVLKRFACDNLPVARKGTVFVGAGDSYAAALAGFYVSGGRCIALDPYVLASNAGFADDADVYFVSVSGRTSSNALAAERVRRHARRTIALTAAEGSRLAGLTDRVVRLPMDYSPRTPGMLSFSLSLLAVLKIAGASVDADFESALGMARKEKLRFSKGAGTTYFLGNSLAYPAALYAAAKTYEILGSRAQAELLEEFSHLQLFSLERTEVVNAFASFDPLGFADLLGVALAKGGLRQNVVNEWGRSAAERLFHAVFVAQLSVLAMARKRGLAAPSFLSSRGALETSDAMIY